MAKASSPSGQGSTAKPLCFNPCTTKEEIFLSSSTTKMRMAHSKYGQLLERQWCLRWRPFEQKPALKDRHSAPNLASDGTLMTNFYAEACHTPALFVDWGAIRIRLRV